MNPRSILVIQLRRIGDVLMATPAVAALKRRYPEAGVDFLVEPPADEVLEGNPHLREVLVYRCAGPGDYVSWIRRVRARRYDWVVDFMGNPRSAVLAGLSGASVRAGPAHVGHRWAYNRRLVQSSTTQYAAREKVRLLAGLGVDAGPESLPRLYLGAARPSPVPNAVGLAPASRQTTRRWPAASFAMLGRLLRERFGCALVVLAAPGERDVARGVARGIGAGARSPETPGLRDAAREIAGLRLLVSNCNGAKHVAVALGVPTLTIHASSDPASWTPARSEHAVVRRDELPCIGCGLNRCPYNLECLDGLSPERVFEAACKMLESPPSPSRLENDKASGTRGPGPT